MGVFILQHYCTGKRSDQDLDGEGGGGGTTGRNKSPDAGGGRAVTACGAKRDSFFQIAEGPRQLMTHIIRSL